MPCMRFNPDIIKTSTSLRKNIIAKIILMTYVNALKWIRYYRKYSILVITACKRHRLVQDLNLGGNMNVLSRWSIINVKKIIQTDTAFVLYFMSSLNKYALIDELCFQIQRYLSTDFRISIMPFLIKIFAFNCFCQYRQAKKKSNRVTNLFASEGSNHCHLWAVITPE